MQSQGRIRADTHYTLRNKSPLHRRVICQPQQLVPLQDSGFSTSPAQAYLHAVHARNQTNPDESIMNVKAPRARD